MRYCARGDNDQEPEQTDSLRHWPLYGVLDPSKRCYKWVFIVNANEILKAVNERTKLSSSSSERQELND